MRRFRVQISLVLILLLVLSSTTVFAGVNKGFTHGIIIDVDGVEYYFDGAPDGEGGAYDIPGHDWVLVGKNKLVGKHYNTGPFGAPQWWSSDAPDGELLYVVKAVIDEWTLEKSEMYAAKGYVHYHELIEVDGGELHPTKVVWLKHIARTTFTLDGGPAPGTDLVTPGVDEGFINNYYVPYAD